jgi:ribosomal protein S18 acetylase RimI-like enzyme
VIDVADVVHDFTLATAAAGLERNFAEIQALYARAAGGEVLDLRDVRFSASGLPARVVNAVNMAHLTEASAPARIEEAKAFFGRHGVPFRWLFGVTTTPADLPERLEAAGLAALSNTPGMGLDIPAMHDEPPDVPGLEVREVASSSELETWLEVCRLSFPFDDVTAAAWRDVHHPLGWGDDTPLHNYIGWLSGRPVAGSAVFYAGGVAGIWNVGTMADVRGRGIGRETTLAALRDAARHGYRVAILGSSPMGFPVYTRIGFVEVCRNRHFGPPA